MTPRDNTLGQQGFIELGSGDFELELEPDFELDLEPDFELDLELNAESASLNPNALS